MVENGKTKKEKKKKKGEGEGEEGKICSTRVYLDLSCFCFIYNNF